MNVPGLGGTWSRTAAAGLCLPSQKLQCAPETPTGAGSARILVPVRAPESRLCLCQSWDPGPVTHPRPHPSPCKWRQGDKWRQASSQDCCPHCLQKLGFVDKPCLTQRHSGYINISELSHPYLEIWDSGVIFMLHKFIPKKKRLKKSHLIKSYS